jgi:GNAT superfamily N-acetyltransferase
MPLPAYLTQQPEITPTEAIARRIGRMGFEVTVTRKGQTLQLFGVDSDAQGHATARKAIRTICEFADSNRLTIEAAVPAIFGGVVVDYEANGFNVVFETDDNHEQGAHCLLRRAAA